MDRGVCIGRTGSASKIIFLVLSSVELVSKKASTSSSMFEWNFTFGKVMWTAQLLFDHCHDTGRFWLPCNALMQSWSFMYCVGSSINADMTWMSFFTRRMTSCNPTSTGKNWKNVYASGNGVMTKNVIVESEGLVLPGHVRSWPDMQVTAVLSTWCGNYGTFTLSRARAGKGRKG